MRHVSAPPDGTNAHLAVSSLTTTEVEIEFEQLTVNTSVSGHYFYDVQYKAAGGSFTEVLELQHDREKSRRHSTIRGLDAGTEYIIRVIPVRKDFLYNTEEPGLSLPDITVTTGRLV